MANRPKNRWLTRPAVVMAVALALMLSACGGTGGAGDGTTAPPTTADGGTDTTADGGTESGFEGLNFVYASAADSIGIFKVVGDNIVTDAEALGIGMKRYDNDLDGEKALANANLMVQDNPDVAIDWNTFVGVGTAVGKIFTDAGIPCLAVNQQIPGCHWFNLSNAQIGIDAAAIVGAEAQARGWTGEDTTILMVIAAANGREVNDGPRHFYVELAQMLEGFEQVGPEDIEDGITTNIGSSDGVQIDCLSTIEGANTAARNVLPSIPAENNILLMGSDTDCTLGALRAIEDAGRADNTLTCGLGATPEGLLQLRTNPSWLCEAALFLEDWPLYILAEAVAIANGVTPPDLTPAPQIMLTKDNVDQYYEGDSVIQLPPFVEGNQYLVETGVFQALDSMPAEG